MSITATVENGAIRLPSGIHLPDGTAVRIETMEGAPAPEVVEAWLRRACGAARPGVSTDALMAQSRGEE